MLRGQFNFSAAPTITDRCMAANRSLKARRGAAKRSRRGHSVTKVAVADSLSSHNGLAFATIPDSTSALCSTQQLENTRGSPALPTRGYFDLCARGSLPDHITPVHQSLHRLCGLCLRGSECKSRSPSPLLAPEYLVVDSSS